MIMVQEQKMGVQYVCGEGACSMLISVSWISSCSKARNSRQEQEEEQEKKEEVEDEEKEEEEDDDFSAK